MSALLVDPDPLHVVEAWVDHLGTFASASMHHLAFAFTPLNLPESRSVAARQQPSSDCN